MSALPVIDFSQFTNGEKSSLQEKSAVAAQTYAACRDIGFFYAVGHGVSAQTLKRVVNAARKFFDLPLAVKESIGIERSPSVSRGYQRLGQNMTQGQHDAHEGFDMFRELPPSHALVRAGIPLADRNQWPTEQPELQEVIDEFVAEMLQCGESIMRAIALGLGLHENYFQQFYTESFWVSRLIRYPPLGAKAGKVASISEPACTKLAAGAVGCGEHTDYGCLTMVVSDDTRGCLQVKSHTSSDWIVVNPLNDAFVVNIGDMLQLWTNGLFKATPHRVVRPSDCSRVAIPFFFEPNYDAVVAPIDCLRDKSAVSMEPVIYGEHLFSKTSSNFDLSPKL